MPRNRELDEYLVDMVQTANNYKSDAASQGITLVVGGVVVSGNLIAAHRWFEEMGHSLGGREDGPNSFSDEGDALRETRDKIVAAVEKLSENDETTEAAQVLQTYGEPRYIHLRDARIISGPAIYPSEGMHWRGLLKDVSGWSVGTMSRAEPGQTPG